MNTRVKKGILTVTLGLGLTLGFTQLLNKKGGEPVEEVNKVAEYKAKSREKVKPHRYDGSKITHFTYNTFEQKKVVEVLMFNGIDYKFCFNLDGVPKSIDIKIYDKDETAKDRILVYSADNVMGKDIIITSEEMLKNLQAKKNVSSLKKVFIEYNVPISDKAPEKPVDSKGREVANAPSINEKGVVVVSFGYKNT